MKAGPAEALSARERQGGKRVFDVERVREDFPILKQKVHGKPLVYLDNAATSQKPVTVIEAEERFYREYNSNIHRGVHQLSERATKAYEDARVKIQHFLNAGEARELVFVRGTTEAINLVAAPHLKVDVRELDCDFYAMSSHKIFGPTGIGVLYGKARLLEAMPPYQGGGDMISSVSFEKTIYNVIPYKFEAGTPNIAATIGLGAAIDYINQIGLENVAAYEHELLEYATEALSRIPGVRIVGTARQKASVISFVLDGIHAHDVGTVLDQEGIAVRTGHHCAQPLMERFQVPATARASLAFYNTKEEVDRLAAGIEKVKHIFG